MKERIIALPDKSLNELSLDKAEKKELDNWLTQPPHNRSIFEKIINPEKLQQDVKEMLAYTDETCLQSAVVNFNIALY